MAAVRHSPTDAVAPSGATRQSWRPLQAGFLGVGLVMLAAVMYLGAAPGGAARQAPPSAPSAGDGATAARSLPSPPARQHLVLLVGDPALGDALQRRILAGELITARFGAYAAPLIVEVIVANDDDAADAMIEGLREFEALCVAESCAAIRVLDLRAAD